MDESATSEERERLIAAHLDDALDAPAAAQLHAWLREDPAARRLLLAAATQATVLPRAALEHGLARPPAPRPAPPGRRHAAWPRWAALAAVLVLGLGLWSRLDRPVAEVRLSAEVAVLRDGQRLASTPAVRAGDRLEVGPAGARLHWTDEGTAIELGGGARLSIERLGRAKRLRLDQGLLTAEVAPQGDGGLVIATPSGEVAVVGTRFRVQVEGGSSQVTVEHGAVRVTAGVGGAPVTVGAGFSARLADGRISAQAPSAALPSAGAPAASGPAALPPGTVRLGVDGFRAEDGWEGDLVDGAIRGRAVEGSPVTRITTPTRRPDGVARFGPDLRCRLALSVDHATSLAVLLVCDDPAGGERWLANLQAERRIEDGAQQVVFSGADFRQVAGGAPPPAGSRIVAVAVMAWQPAADLRLRWIEIGR